MFSRIIVDVGIIYMSFRCKCWTCFFAFSRLCYRIILSRKYLVFDFSDLLHLSINRIANLASEGVHRVYLSTSFFSKLEDVRHLLIIIDEKMPERIETFSFDKTIEETSVFKVGKYTSKSDGRTQNTQSINQKTLTVQNWILEKIDVRWRHLSSITLYVIQD